MLRLFLDLKLEVGNYTISNKDTINHIHALRLKNDDTVDLFDGRGNLAHATISNIEKKSVIVQIKAVKSTPQNSQILCLAIGLIANDKMDLVIQKAVELGVSQIIPLYTVRSQRISNDRLTTRVLHWQKIIISSCEQCGQNILPLILEPTNLNDLFAKHNNYEQKIVLALDHKKTSLKNNHKSTILLVGSEGGLTPSEMDLIYDNGYTPIHLGSLVLRSETAAIAGLSLINFGGNI